MANITTLTATSMFETFPIAAAYVSAALLLLIVRSGDLQILVKTETQRTKTEQASVSRGLKRSIVLDCLVFVPASVSLLLLIEPILIPQKLRADHPGVSLYAIIGIASYGFPFAAIRRAITRVALKTLQEFAAISNKQ
jgi:hypothetical protein